MVIVTVAPAQNTPLLLGENVIPVGSVRAVAVRSMNFLYVTPETTKS